MKKLLAFIITAAVAASALAVPASAGASSRVSDRLEKYTEETRFPKTSYSVDEKVVLNKSKKNYVYSLPESFTLYVRSGGRLVIDGAFFYAWGNIVVEKGGVIEIKNKGAFTAEGKVTNYGTISAAKNCRVNFSGDYVSNGSAELKCKGDVFLNGGRAHLLAALNDTILQYDGKFSLDNYVLKKEGSRAYLYYRIGEVETDHYYAFELSKKKLKLENSGIAPEKVYDKQTAEALKAAVADFLKDSGVSSLAELHTDKDVYLGISDYFTYSYETGEMYYGFDGQSITTESGSSVMLDDGDRYLVTTVKV